MLTRNVFISGVVILSSEHPLLPVDGGGRRRTWTVVFLRNRQSHRLADPSLGSTTSEVSLPEVVQVGRVDRPVVTLAVGAAAGLDEAVVQGEVVADAVPPAGASAPEVGIVVQNPLVDLAQDELLVVSAEDGHGDQTDVAMTRLRFLVQESRPWVTLV